MRPESGLPAEVLREALDAAPDGILVVDDAGTIVAVNRMIAQLFGYTHDELVGISVDQLLPEATRGSHAAHRREYADRPRTRSMGSGLALRARRQSGSEFPVEISLSPLPTETGLLVVVIIRDITERLGADEELQRVHEELALVDDRERIARDLHDTVIQRLFAVGLSLQGALRPGPAATRWRNASSSPSTRSTSPSATYVRRSSRCTRAATRPRARATRSWPLRAKPRGSWDSIRPCASTAPSTPSSPTVVRDHLLATLRESLSNVTKHAQATSVSVHLAVSGHDLCLTICDDGIGMVNPGAGNGVPNMRNRAVEFGGDCKISTPAGGGTQIEWRISLGS